MKTNDVIVTLTIIVEIEVAFFKSTFPDAFRCRRRGGKGKNAEEPYYLYNMVLGI